MKKIIRTVIFTILGLGSAQYLIGSFDYGSDRLKAILLIVLGLSLLFLFLKPLVAIVSLPTRGLGFAFLTFAMSVIIIYVSTLFIPTFSIHSASVSNLMIFGMSIPSFDLTSLQAMVFSGLIICLMYSFLESLCHK